MVIHFGFVCLFEHISLYDVVTGKIIGRKEPIENNI